MRQGRILFLLGLIAIHSLAGSASAMGDVPFQDTQYCVQEVDPVAASKDAIKAVGSVQDVGNITVMEFEGDYARGLTAPRQEIAERFYASHADTYDFLIVFSTFEFETGNAVAFHNRIRNDTLGIGLPLYDHSGAFGSAGRLQGFIDMAAVGRYSFAPSSPRYQDLLATFLHEVMHRWGMDLHFIDGDGNPSNALLSLEQSHWSYFLDSDASVMLGNDWQVQPDGSFRSVDARHRYSPVDLYAAGFASPAEVHPLLLIRNGTGGTPVDVPRVGATSAGTAEMVSIEQIVEASGPRVPPATTSQKDFSAAFILLKRPGEIVAPDRLVDLERLRIRAAQQFVAATDGRATLRIYTESRAQGMRLPEILQGSGAADVAPGVAAAAAWLEDRQEIDGHWQDRPATAMRDTVAVVAALTELDPHFPGLPLAREWIAANAASNLDQTSWRLLGAGLGQDATSLTSHQNADGGFAIEPRWTSGPYDTALVGAALADRAPGSAALASALLRVGVAQNQDGSIGVVEGGPGRTLPTLRAAAMFAAVGDSGNLLRLQRATDWISSRQSSDGGIGNPSGVSSLPESIETYALTGRIPLADMVANGLRNHVRQRQQVDGDWGGSVYLTATAALAHARDQRANLVVEGGPVAVPDSVHDGQRMIMQAVVANLGNVAAAPSVLRWYDGNPDEGGIQIGNDAQVPNLVARSRATTSVEWDTTNQVGDHTLWVVVDAASTIEESSEQDNRSILAATVLPPSAIADLALFSSDFIATPSNVVSLPSTIHVAGLVRNPGIQDAPGVVVRVHERAQPAIVLAESSIDVPARGTATVGFDVVANEPRTLDLVIRADPDNHVPEASESNNEAEVRVSFDQTLDLEILSSDVQLLVQPALVGRSVNFDIGLRNRGTVDSPPIVLRAEVVQGASTTVILDAPVQVPAGQGVIRRATWLPPQPGSARLSVSIDPANLVPEADEGNNSTQLDLDILALDQPDLTFVGESLEFTPTPALEGHSLTARLGVRNLGSVATGEVLVAIYAGDPENGAAALGSVTLGTIGGSGNAIATINVPDLNLRGDQTMFVRIDADDRIAEADETNNVVILPLRVLPLPDVVISVADIELVPPLPVPGETVQARVTVRNIGAQDATDVSVRMLEGNAETGVAVASDGSAGFLPAGASTVLTWTWTLGLSPGSRSVTAIADPEFAIREGSEDNNAASLPFDVQDGDLFANERYISPNGDGIQDAVAVVFRMEGAGPATVEISGSAGHVVRRYDGVHVNEALRGQVIWDGRNDRGRIVTDGTYQVSVAAMAGPGPEGSIPIIVDNNQSSFLTALGTPYAVTTQLPDTLRLAKLAPVESPASKHLFGIGRLGGTTEGLLRTDAYFTELKPVITDGWLEYFQDEQGDQTLTFSAFEFSTDGSRIAILMRSSLSTHSWLLETGVDQLDRPAVIHGGNLYERTLGYFDARTIVVGTPDDNFLVIDAESGATSELRGFGYSIPYDSTKVVRDGVVALEGGNVRAFAPRDAAKPVVDFGPANPEWGSERRAILSDGANAIAIHEFDLQVESLSLFDLADSERRILVQSTSNTVEGVLSRSTVAIPKLGMAWLQKRGTLLVQDSHAGTLSVYTDTGLRQSVMPLPGISRMGDYALDDAVPPTRSDPDMVKPSPFVGLVDDQCTASLRAEESGRRLFDPSTDRLYLGSTERVAWEYLSEGWTLTQAAGIQEYFAVDVDSGDLVTTQSISRIPLILSTDAAAYPHRALCADAPPGSWPHIVLRDGSRIGRDGRVYTESRGASAEAWLTENNRLTTIWPDDSGALHAEGLATASLLDLGIVLRARTLGRGIELRGVAADRNFDSYTIDWAAIEHPNIWNAVTTASSDEVFFDEFLTWVPPQPGTFRIRLTVFDKAGNSATAFATASSFDSAPIDGFSIAPRYLSPNGDGVQDSTLVKFRVRQPTTLSIRIADSLGSVVRSLERTYATGQLGPDEFAWDGRDQGGAVVVDGRYRITLGGFGAWTIVDSALPVGSGELRQAYGSRTTCINGSCRELVLVEPGVSWTAADANLVSASLQSRPITGGGQWTAASMGWPPTRSQFIGKAFRVHALDRAGNASNIHIGDAEAALILAGATSFESANSLGAFDYQPPPFSETPDASGWQALELDAASSNIRMRAIDYAGGIVRVAVQTAALDAPGTWVERSSHLVGDLECAQDSECSPGDAGRWWIPFDPNGFVPGSTHLVRMSGERLDGSRVGSNAGLVRIGGLDPPTCEPTSTSGLLVFAANEHFAGAMSDAVIRLGSYQDAQTVPASLVTDGRLEFQLVRDSYIGRAWVEASDETGLRHRSAIVDLACDPDPDDAGGGLGLKLKLVPTPVIEDRCDGLPSHRVRLETTIEHQVQGGESIGSPQSVRVSYLSGASGEEVEIYQGLPQTSSWPEHLRRFEIQTEGWPEGEYEARIALSYEGGNTLTRTRRFPVVHGAPAVQIVSPGQGERICTSPVASSPLHRRFPVGVDVISPTASSYRILVGQGAQSGERDCLLQKGELPSASPFDCRAYDLLEGFDGHFPLGDEAVVTSELPHLHGIATVQLKAVNWSGGTACSANTVLLDSALDFRVRAPPRTLLQHRMFGVLPIGVAPAAGGSYATANLYLRAEELVDVTATVHRADQDPVTGRPVMDPAVLGTLMNLTEVEGEFDISWDGSVNGVTVADGFYALNIQATDDCGHSDALPFWTVVDSTPPAGIFTRPLPADVIVSPVVQIEGSVTDNMRVQSWSLDFALAASPNAWHNLANGDRGAAPGTVLASWSRGSITGTVELRLRAIDHMGNQSDTRLPITLGEPATLIGAATLEPAMFSPNSDGTLDSTRLQLALLRPADIDIRIVDAGNSAIETLYSGTQLPGTAAWSWMGTTASGQSVPDGTYQIRINALDPEGIAAPESVTLAAVVDKTAPSLEITSPSGTYAAPTAFLKLRIADAHYSGFDARLTRIADSAIVLSVSDSQDGDIVLAPLSDFADGAYIIHAIARDAAGNVSVREHAFQIDAGPPVVHLDVPETDALIPSGSPTSVIGGVDDANLSNWMLVVAAEDGSNQVTLAGGETNVPSGQLFSWTPGLGDGRYRLRLHAVDQADNQAEVAHLVHIDGTPPTASITSPSEGGFLGADALVQGTANDAHLEVYRLAVATLSQAAAGQWSDVYAGSDPVVNGTLGALTLDVDEGDYILRLVATDRVGLSSEAQVHVRIDSQAPASPLALAGHVEGNRNVVLEWQPVSAADLRGYLVYRDGQRLTPQSVPSPDYIDLDAPEGSFAYRVTAVDHADNESEPSNAVTLLVDRTPPTAAIARPSEGERVRGAYDILGTAHSADDFKQYRLTMQSVEPPGATVTLATATLAVQGQTLSAWDTLQLVDETRVRLVLEAEDVRGNVATSEVVVTIDNAPPTAPTGLAAAIAGADAQLNWNPNSEADLLGYLLYRDNELVNATGTNVPGDLRPFALTNVDYLDEGVPDGQHQYVVYAIDRAGNVSPPSEPASLDPLDNAPPSMVIESPSPGARFETEVLVFATSRDTDIAEVRFAYRPPGGTDWTDIGPALTEAPYRVTWQPGPALAYGDYEIRALARDVGGRLDPAPPTVRIVYADLTPPLPPLALTARGDDVAVHLAWSASDASDLAGYRAYRDGIALEDVPPDILTLDDRPLADGSYTYVVKAVDTSGNESAPSTSAVAHVFGVSFDQPYTPTPDVTADLTGWSARPGSIHLHVEDGAGVSDVPMGPTAPDGRFELGDRDLQVGPTMFTLEVVDAAGNVSRAATVRVDRGMVPAAPTGLQLTVDDHQALLRWDPNPEADVIGYRVFRNGAPLETDHLLGELPVASSAQGSDPGAAVDSDPSTAWSAYVRDGSADLNPDWIPELELAWLDPRIVAAVDLSWSTAETAAFGVDVFAWSGHAWVRVAQRLGGQAAEETVSLAFPYRTTRVKFVFSGNSEVPDVAERELHLSEVRLRERPLQGARNLAETLADGSYAYQVTAVNAFAFESSLSDAVVADIGDTQGPDPVTLSGELMGRDAHLSWTASAAPDVARYDLARNGVIVASTTAGQPREYVDAGLAIGAHAYVVVPVDGGGNAGVPSNAVMLTLEGEGPPVPVGLAVMAPLGGAALDVAWQPAPGSTPDYYVLRRGLSAAGPHEIVAKPSDTTYRDAPLNDGTTYYYTVEAVDAFGDGSGPSEAASGTPRDRLAPGAPDLTYPTTASARLHQQAPITDICGRSEASATIHLERAGVVRAVVTANALHSTSESALPISTEASLPAPDGRHVAVTDYSSTRIIDLLDSSMDHIGPRSRLQRWAAHGLALYFLIDASDEIFRWEPARGIEQVSHPVTAIRGFAVDAREARFAIVGEHAPAGTAIWIVDRSGGAPLEVQGLHPISMGVSPAMSWSPDGTHLLFAEDGEAWVIEGDTGVVVAQWTIDPDVAPAWSSDSRFVAYAQLNAIGGDDLHAFDIAMQTGVLLATSDRYAHAIAWSPANDELAVLDTAGINILAWPSGLVSFPLTQYTPHGWMRMMWTASGTLVAYDEGSLLRVDLPGWFCARSTALVAGINRWSSRATDLQGNHGLGSAPIEIEVPSGDLPDLVIGASDVKVIPAAGMIGQAYGAAITLRNAGATEIAHPELAVDLDRPDGSRIALSGPVLPPLAPGQARTTSYPIGILAMAGTYRVSARADPSQSLFESNEDNNGAVGTFVVGVDGTPVIEAALSQSIYAPDEVVRGDVSVTNPGASFSGYVNLRIIDAGGVLVADLGEYEVPMLGFGQRWQTPVAWEASDVLAGDYRLRASLRAAGGTELAAQEIAFEVAPVRHIQLAVRAETPSQIIGRDVIVRSEVDFSDGNALMEGALLRLVVLDGDGSEQWRRDQPLGTLLPGHTLAREDAWPTSGLAEGVYVLRLSLLSTDYQGSVEASVTLHDDVPGISLSGAIDFEPGVPLIAGQGQLLRWRIVNDGDVDLAAVDARLRVVAMPAQTLVDEVAESFSLAVASSHSSSLGLDAPPLTLAVHAAVLEARLPDDPVGNWRLLAQQGFSVVDRLPPAIEILAPGAGAMQAAVVPFRAAIIDEHSAVAAADVSVDGGSWLPVSAGSDGHFARGIAGLVDGAHVLRVKARDTWGNETQSHPIPFLVDATPPLIVIAGITDDELANHPLTPQVHISDTNLATSEILLDGIAFVPGTPVGQDGGHVLSARGVDEAGNQSLRSVRFTIDQTPPVVEIVSPADGVVVDVPAVQVEVRTESNASVVLATGAYQANRTTDEQGRTVFDGVPLVLGSNQVGVVATDRAGNVGLPAEINLTYAVSSSTPLTGTLQPTVAELAHGDPLAMRMTVVNPNAEPVAAQTLRVRVVGATGELASRDFAHDFVPNEVFEVDMEFPSTSWPLGTLSLVLELDDAGAWAALDMRQLELVDRTPPSLAVEVPAADAVMRSPVVVSATASDTLSGVGAVEARVDGSDWLALSNAGGDVWLSPSLNLADGSHHVELRANDGAGNAAAVEPVPFTIDTTAPLINISGVADGDLLAKPVAPEIDITDAHLETSDVRLNGLPYTSGTSIDASGEYLLEASASDLAGNASSYSVHFALDLDAPDVVFLAPEPGVIVTGETVDVMGQTEPRARVRLQNGSFEAVLDADATGRFEVRAVPLEPGENMLAADAVDLAGNVGTVSTLIVFREVVAEADVVGDIGLLPATLSEGAWLDVPYSVRNIGGLALSGMPLRFELRQAVGGELVVYDEFPLDLPLGAVWEGVHLLDTRSVVPGSYRLSMRAHLPGATGPVWIALDVARLTIESAGCRRSDELLADGFDGKGVRRDRVIFCDGFELRARPYEVFAARLPPELAEIARFDLPMRDESVGEPLRHRSWTVRAKEPAAPPVSSGHMFSASPAPSRPSYPARREVAMLSWRSAAPRGSPARTSADSGRLGGQQ